MLTRERDQNWDQRRWYKWSANS